VKNDSKWLLTLFKICNFFLKLFFYM
jgi:hypothetical protein